MYVATSRPGFVGEKWHRLGRRDSEGGLDAVRIGNRFSRWSSGRTGRLNMSSGDLNFAMFIVIVIIIIIGIVISIGRSGRLLRLAAFLVWHWE